MCTTDPLDTELTAQHVELMRARAPAGQAPDTQDSGHPSGIRPDTGGSSRDNTHWEPSHPSGDNAHTFPNGCGQALGHTNRSSNTRRQ